MTRNDQPRSVDRQVQRGARQVVYAPSANEAPKQPFKWRVYLRRAGFLALITSLIWVIFFSGWLNIRSISLQGKHSLTKETVASDIESYLKEFPTQRNVLFLQPSELARFIEDQHPTINKVNINRTLLLGVKVNINETQPALVWQSAGRLWLVGEDGHILRVAQASDTSYGRVVDTAQIEVREGDKVADARFVEFTRSLFSQANEKNITIEYLSIGETTREVLAMVKGGVVIKMAVERGAGEQLEAYLATVADAKKAGRAINEYVDVRVVGKTYYK